MARGDKGGRAKAATGRLASGVGLLLAGRPVEARQALVEATEAADASAPLSAAAALVRGIAALMAGDLGGILEVEDAAERAEALGLGWFSRLARAALVLSRGPGTRAEAIAVRQACLRDGDHWLSGFPEALATTTLAGGWKGPQAAPSATPRIQ